MNRMMIIGCAGSGKSTLAKQLGQILQLPVCHLDYYYWKPGWVPTPPEEWDSFQETLVQEEQWIIDGNYNRTLEIRMRRADVIILLDYSRWITVYRVLKRRVMYHGKTRPDLNEQCPESLDWEFMQWIWTFKKTKVPQILEKLNMYSDKKIIILKAPKETKEFLEQVKAKGMGSFE